MVVLDVIASWQSWVFFAILYLIGSLLWPLVFPTIIAYPWASVAKEKKRSTVVLAGSFNPPHRGHYAMLKYLSERHVKVICVVGCNPNKKYDVTPEDRARLLRTMLADLANVEVQIVSTYIWRYAKQRGCRIMYRGIRSWEKDGKEEQALHILNTWGPLVLGPTWPIPSHYLEGQPEYNHISSTLIRTLLSNSNATQQAGRSMVKAELTKLIPEAIVDETMALYSRTTDKQLHKT